MQIKLLPATIICMCVELPYRILIVAFDIAESPERYSIVVTMGNRFLVAVGSHTLAFRCRLPKLMR